MKTKTAFEIIVAIFISLLVVIAFIFLIQLCTPPGCTSLDTSGYLNNIVTQVRQNIPKAYVVQSGSMEPAIRTGSLVITLPAESYYKDDVITFNKDSSNTLVTHRIYAKTYPEGINSPAKYLTAGDANEDFDRWEITDSNILGKVVYTIPYLGYIANLAKTPQGFIILIIVPSTIIIYEELKVMAIEIKKSLKDALEKIKSNLNHKQNRNDSTSHNDKASLYVKVATVIPIFGAILVLAGLASSYFFDEEDSLGNVFSAATSYGSPTPTPQPDGGNNQTVIRLGNIGADPQYGYTHDYSNAVVTFSYETPANDVLSGEISASGLKPYATYQLKFEGTPTCANASGDDALNEIIGYKGRWWDIIEGNKDDSFYEANSEYQGGDHCIVGYLVWDYITADSSGNASKSVSTSSSYHVLRCGGGVCGTVDDSFLDTLDVAHNSILFCPADKVNGELERFSCGGLVLDPGTYHLKIILNEESFHQYSYGNWTAVMDSPIDFTIY